MCREPFNYCPFNTLQYRIPFAMHLELLYSFRHKDFLMDIPGIRCEHHSSTQLKDPSARED